MALNVNNEEVVVRNNYPVYTELTGQLENLSLPYLFRIKNDVQAVLRNHFNEANVSIVNCPDLRQSPFNLVAQGLSGNTAVMEVGGPEYLWKYPMPDVKRSWKITDLINQFYSIRTSSFVIGASRLHGAFNSEVAINFMYSQRRVTNKSYFNFVNEKGRCESKLVIKPSHVICDQYGSFFICKGSSGNVLKICAKGRQTDMNFPTVIQLALRTRYEPNYFIGLGGTFVINNGIVRNEIRRPSFALDAPSEKICDTFTPLVAVGTILSRCKHSVNHQQLFGGDAEPTQLKSNITTQNFHTFACNGDVGGHFINDITPDDIEYEGYFSLAKRFIRISPPQQTYELPY